MANITVGIVGLPNVGKSTLFNALTKKSVPAENYPFCTIDPSYGIIPVFDERLHKLSEFSKSKKEVPSVIEFVDIAGLVKGASKGEGKGNDFLRYVGECEALVHVVRIFEDEKVHHVDGRIDPLSDIETINLELIFKDIETVSNRLDSLQKDLKRGDKQAFILNKAIEKLLAVLESGRFAINTDLEQEEEPLVKQLQLLTMKPMMYALNKKSGGKNLDEQNDERFKKLLEFLKETEATYTLVDASIENELKEFVGEEKETFRKEMGVDNDGLDSLVKRGYSLLGLESFFTTGEDETRAWTIKRGSTAPIAGTAIHTDFKDKFIRAEVIEWDKLLQAGSYANAREKGLLRTEGKEYIVKDGDVIEFRI
jgi:hypothetical protein